MEPCHGTVYVLKGVDLARAISISLFHKTKNKNQTQKGEIREK